MIKQTLTFLFFLILCWAPVSYGATELPEPAGRGPIDVTADRLDVDEQNGTAVFIGQVVATQGDMTVYADKLVVRRDQKTEQVEKIEASGGVRVVQQDRIATAQQAVFYQLEEKLILNGAAEIRQGQNMVSGEEIVFFLKDNRSLVKSGEDGRVRAVFFPEQEQK